MQLIRLRVPQADRHASLGIAIHKQNLLAFSGQSDAQIGAGGGLADSTLLIGDGDHMAGQGRSHGRTREITSDLVEHLCQE